jgi:NAD-dependent dihydropyrimidine dehydrogenase PreA subunit
MFDAFIFENVPSKRNTAHNHPVPIDKTFRKTWTKIGEHNGHPVWQSPMDHETAIHGSVVGVDFGLCYGCGKCHTACPTHVFEFLLLDPSSVVVDPIRENDCILCLVCEITCPVEAISIESAVGSDDTLDSLLNG